jgi:DNA-binding HxlR family transcriptional regulator
MRHAEVQAVLPVARASEILADRWTPLIVRELILGSHRFNEIERGLPGISRSLLASRLETWRTRSSSSVYPVPAQGDGRITFLRRQRAQADVIETLGAWGVRWAFG